MTTLIMSINLSSTVTVGNGAFLDNIDSRYPLLVVILRFKLANVSAASDPLT